MLFGIPLILCLLLVRNCEANVHFTTGRWEVELGKPLAIEWADANGAVNITLLKTKTNTIYEAVEIIENYTENAFTWTPREDLGLGQFVLRVYDEWSFDESPRLLLSGNSLQDNVRKIIRDTHDEGGGDNDGLPPGAAAGISVGSTLGGVFLLALVAFLVYRGRQNRTKLEHQEAGKGKQKQRGMTLNERS